jgi:nucleotide sugar dehydrogenase
VKIAVVALGKIGLPLAVQFASKGHTVMGADIDERVVELVNSGVEPFPGEAELQTRLSNVVSAGLLTATTSTADAVAGAEAVVIVVPLFVDPDGVPDFGWMDSATQAVAAALSPGTLVAYETTLPVGTTRKRFQPMLEQGSGLRCGIDFFLTFSPERVFTGRVFSDLKRYPKLVGGIGPRDAEVAVSFYQAVLDFEDRPELPRANGVWDLGSTEAAELAKLAETTYRDVNIGLANQFARFADQVGVDVTAVIDASNSQPFSHIHQPGIAVGGHCIPIYPQFYLWNDPEASIVSAARQTNESMPEYAVLLLEQMHGSLANQRVVVLGATAFSGVVPTVSALESRGAEVMVHDPLFSDDELITLRFRPYHLGEGVDAVIVQADHDVYRSLMPDSLPGVRTILDGRRITAESSWSGVTHGFIGSPTTGHHS